LHFIFSGDFNNGGVQALYRLAHGGLHVVLIFCITEKLGSSPRVIDLNLTLGALRSLFFGGAGGSAITARSAANCSLRV
jgi:hypothetical protein